MRRFAALLLAAPFMFASAAPPWPTEGDGNPSVLDPSVPLSYVGNDGSVSLGINGEGRTEGQLLGVFARSNERAVIGQLWWDRSSAGGVQGDFNWLWGIDAIEARLHPDQATVARLSFAIDQNAEHDRKATLGFGIERREFALDAYLAGGISGTRDSGHSIANTSTTTNGTDAIGAYTQVDTTAVDTLFGSKPYAAEFGLQLSHTFDPLGIRLHAGSSVQQGGGAHATTASIGVDTPLGTRGWGLSALGEHVNRRGSLDGGNDDRLSVFLRYEFGSRGSFVPTSQLEDPAWITRALAQPSSAHPRIVESYQVRRSQTTTLTRGPKQYSNHFPIAHDDAASAIVGQTTPIDVLANDSDPDGDPLTITAVTTPSHGSAAISGRQILYTPAAGATGSDSFRYTVSDGHGGAASATVTVTLTGRPDQPPVARNDTATASFGRAVTIDVLANDSDPDGDALSLASVASPLHGTATISGRSIVYTPAPGYSGSDRFSYTISDGRGGTATAEVSVTVSAQPDRAPIAVDDVATTGFGRAVTIDVLGNDRDPDGDPLSVASVTTPLHGTAARSGNSVLYTPAAGYAGADTFRYVVTDGRGGSATATVNVTVTAQPDRAPVAVDDAATTPAGQAVTIPVLANDSDPDGDPLTITAVTAPSLGTAVISGTTVVYTPAAGVAGTDRFTYTISDGRGGSATANVVVTIAPPPNRPPVAVDDAATTPSGQAVTIAVLANDSDPDGDPLTITAVTAPSLGTAVISGATIVYTPAAGVAGTDRFTYTISDGRGGSATANVTVTITPPANRPPVAVADAATTLLGQPVTIPVLANDSDPDGDPLSIVSVTAPTAGTAVIAGTNIVYTPALRGVPGVQTFSYTITDGRGGTASAVVTVTITAPPNQPPVAVDDSATTAFATAVSIPVLANDSDPDGDPLTIVSVTTPSGGSAVITGQSVLYTPSVQFSGVDRFGYTISDGRGGTAGAFVTVVVNPIPRPSGAPH